MMDKRFDSKSIEIKWYQKWLESGAFASNNSSSKKTLCNYDATT